VPANVSPPIDSIGFKTVNNNLQVYVNTHDPNNATHYYRWDYTETWQFHAHDASDYITNDTIIVSRTAAQDIYQCWSNDISTNIELASSAKLSQDVIYQNPLLSIPSTSEKIEIRYSILLKQYAMTSAGYNYYSLLKQNTEQLGSIFDAQPSTLTGNIHCTTNSTIPVIGYVTAGAYAMKRIYIDRSQLPDSWITIYPYTCSVDTALYADPKAHGANEVQAILIPKYNPNVIIQALTHSGQIIGYTYTDHDCGDCSIRGTTVQPGFWINAPYDN